MTTGYRYRHAALALLSICLVWFSLLDRGQISVSFSSLLHDAARATVELVADDLSSPNGIRTTSPSTDRLHKDAVHLSFTHWLHRFIIPLLSREPVIGLQQADRPIVCLISVLHKKNGWHQSSQDDPHLNPLSFT
jgi:hypothetical protein